MKNPDELKNEMKQTKILSQNIRHYFYTIGMDFSSNPQILEVRMGKGRLVKGSVMRLRPLGLGFNPGPTFLAM